jgi:hypothetical protein
VSLRRLKFSLLSQKFAICRFAPEAPIPDWADRGPFTSITRNQYELSIVCPEGQVPEQVQAEREWICLKLEGPIPFSETGVLSSFVKPLSDRAIPIFVVSTYDTDYVLVKETWAKRALAILKEAGHEFVP